MSLAGLLRSTSAGNSLDFGLGRLISAGNGLGFGGLALVGEAGPLAAASFEGVDMLVSLSVAAWPGRVLGAVLLGDPDIVFGVIVLCLELSPGLVRSVEGPS